MTHPLDDLVWSALTNADASLSLGSDRARRYRPDVSPFAGVADDPEDLNHIEVEGAMAVINTAAPAGWTTLMSIHGFQMVAPPDVTVPDSVDEVVALGFADVADMIELTSLAKPGPFEPRTIELGGYVGIRREGRLIAMAGERMHPLGWAEVSAVCTHPDFRGQGLASVVMMTVAQAVAARGDRAFLHVVEENRNAIRLYETLGWSVRRESVIDVIRR